MVDTYLSKGQASTGIATPDLNSETFGGNIGAAISQLGQGISQVADYKKQLQTEDTNLQVANTAVQHQGAQQKILSDSMQSAPIGAPDFAKDYLDQYDQSAQSLVDAQPNQQAKLKLSYRLNEARNSLGQTALTFQASQMAAKDQSDTQQTSDTRATMAFSAADVAGAQKISQQNQDDILSGPLKGSAQLKAIQTGNRNIAYQYFAGQIQADPQKAMDQLKDPDNPLVPLMHPDDHESLINQAVVQQRRELTEGAHNRGQARVMINQNKQGMLQGISMDPDSLAMTDDAVKVAGDPNITHEWQKLKDQQSLVQKWQTEGPVDLSKQVADMGTTLNSGKATAEDVSSHQMALQTLKGMVSGYKNDRMSYVGQAQKVDVGSPFKDDGSVDPSEAAKRVSAVGIADQRSQGQGNVMPDAEARTQADLFAKGSPAQQLQQLDNINQNFGNVAPRMFDQIGGKNQTIGYIAGLASDPGSRKAAEDALRGAAILKNNKLAVSLGDSAKDDINSAMSDTLGNATQYLGPQRQAQIMSTAKAIYVARNAQSAHPTTDGVDSNLMKQAIQDATGSGVHTYAGQNLILPQGVTGEQFDGVLKNLTPEYLKASSASGNGPTDSKGNPITVDQVRNAKLVNGSRPNSYYVMGPGGGVYKDGPYAYQLNIPKVAR